MSRAPLHFGLIGWPVAGSLSPRLHQAALEGLGLKGTYTLFPVPEQPAQRKEESLGKLIEQLRSGELDGLNVTLPHKTAILHYVDNLSRTALTIGAVNTLFRSGDQVVGDNTDALGFWADLLCQFPGLSESAGETLTALVLGAGGAARAVVNALLSHGWQVIIAARRLEQAELLVASLNPGGGDSPPSALPLDARSLLTLQAQLPVRLLVNATPLGMAPNTEWSPWPVEVGLPAGAVIYDLVYRPRETALVRAARAAGLPAASGGGMLVEQAALSFECWTITSAPRAAMQLALEEALAGP